MKYIFGLFTVLFLSSCAQTGSSENPYSKEILEQAHKMGDLILKRDYDSFIQFVDPEMLRLFGGKDKMINMMHNGDADMDKGGFKIKSATFGEPSAIVDTASMLQCIVPEALTMGTPKGDIVNNSCLLAISRDKGKTWVFADITDQEKLVKVREFMPFISSKLRCGAN